MFRNISWRTTNTLKHFGYLLMAGLIAWFFAYVAAMTAL